jgi:cytoskeletal protein CcmA (bactofilin family)
VSGTEGPFRLLEADFPTPEDALVPEGGVFEGQVAVAGPTRIDGTVRGTLRGNGALLIGRTGRVEGQIDCSEVISQGRVVGPITAIDRACLDAGAHFEGDLAAPVLEVHDDALWVGQAKIGRPVRD